MITRDHIRTLYVSLPKSFSTEEITCTTYFLLRQSPLTTTLKMRLLFLLCVVTLHVTSSQKNLKRTDNISKASVDAFTGARNRLSSKLAQAVTQTNVGNLVFSPISASLIVMMAAYGAKDNTADKFTAAANLNLVQRDIIKATYQYIESFRNLNAQVKLHIANNIFISDELQPKRGYISLMEKVYHSKSESLDFTNSATASKIINDWCAANTDNHIKNFVEPSKIDSSTRLMLLSAVYFKGLWRVPFAPALTRTGTFYSSVEKKRKNVPTMHSIEEFNYGRLESMSAIWVELPYKSGHKAEEVSMFIILPDRDDGLAAVETNVEQLTVQLLSAEPLGSSKISLPKFKIESTIDLEEPFKMIGLGDIFTGKPNFGRITNEPLRVTKASQKAFIEVDEKGSVAAAVSGMEAVSRSFDIISVDHPFLYQIIWRQTRTVLFHGRVADIGDSVVPKNGGFRFSANG